MSFMDKLRKYQRGVLIILVVVTASVFTVTFECAQLFTRPDEGDIAGTFFSGDDKVVISRTTFEDALHRWRSAAFLGSFFAMGSMDALSAEQVFDFYRGGEFKWGQPIPFWRWYEQQDVPSTPGVEVVRETTQREERIRKAVWNVLVLLDVCRMAGITVTNEEVREYITQHFQPIMGHEGEGEQRKPRPFDMETYRAVLRSVMDLEPEAYEQTVAEHLMLSKLRKIVEEGVVVDEEQVFTEFVEENHEMLVYAVRFDPANYARPRYFLSDVLLSEHYHSGHYPRRPNRKMVSFEYVFASIDDVKDKLVEPTIEDLNNFYEGFKEEFYKVEESETPQGTAQGHAPDAATEQTPPSPAAPKFKPFEEVKEDVRKRWLERKAKEECLGAIHRFARELEATILERESTSDTESAQPIPLEPIATKMRLRYGTTRFIPATEMYQLDNLFGKGATWPAAERIPRDGMTDRISTDKGYVMLRLREELDTGGEPFAPEIRKRVEDDYKKFFEKSAARKAAEDFRNLLQAEIDSCLEKEGLKGVAPETLTAEQEARMREIRLAVFDRITHERGVEVLKCGFATKTAHVEKLQDKARDILAVASGAVPGGIFVDSGEPPFFVWQLRARRPPAASDFESQRKDLIERAFRKAAASYIRAWEEALVKGAEVTDNLEVARTRRAAQE